MCSTRAWQVHRHVILTLEHMLTFLYHPAETKKLPWPRFYEDSPDEFDNSVGDALRRVILLGDGTEVSDTEDAEMLDDEDRDEEELEKKRFPGFKGEEVVIAPSNGTPEVTAESC